MKKIVLLTVVGMLALSSCSKVKSPILGLWYLDTSSVTRQYLYTEEYKEFIQTVYPDSTFTFDETVQDMDYCVYGYWDFSPRKGTLFYQYRDGSCKENTLDWSIKGNILSFGKTNWELTTYDENNLAVRLRDTTFFYDENHQKKIANVKITSASWLRELGVYTGSGYLEEDSD